MVVDLTAWATIIDKVSKTSQGKLSSVPKASFEMEKIHGSFQKNARARELTQLAEREEP